MQGFIFGAGFGVRLHPLTDYRPKVTVPVLGKPIIFYAVEKLERLSVSSIIINTHYKPDTLKQIVGGYQCDKKIFYSDEPVILETGGGLFNARNLITDQTVIVYNGDIYSNFNLNKMIEFHKKKKAVATLAVAPWCEPRQISFNSDKRITDIRRTYTSSLPTHTFLGIHIIEKDFLSELALEARENSSFSIIKTYLRLIREKKPIFAYEPPLTDWYDIGSLQAYKHIHSEMFKKNKPKNFSNMQSIKNININGYFYCGKNCEIQENVTLKNVILWDNVKVETGSLLEDVIVTDSKVVSGSHKGKIL